MKEKAGVSLRVHKTSVCEEATETDEESAAGTGDFGAVLERQIPAVVS